MPGPVTLADTIINAAREVFGWWTDEAGRIEAMKRAALKAKREECRRALIDHRYTDLKRLVADLERMSDQA
jgi:hypothetical protein